MRRRRSGTLNILRIAAKNLSISVLSLALLRLRYLVNLRANFHDRATGFLDFLAGAFRKSMRRNAKRLRQFPVAEHHHIMFRLLDDPTIVQEFRGHLFVCFEATIERSQTNFEPALLEDICEPALGQATMQRHLAAFEANLGGVAGTRFLTFFSPAGGLSQT